MGTDVQHSPPARAKAPPYIWCRYSTAGVLPDSAVGDLARKLDAVNKFRTSVFVEHNRTAAEAVARRWANAPDPQDGGPQHRHIAEDVWDLFRRKDSTTTGPLGRSTWTFSSKEAPS